MDSSINSVMSVQRKTPTKRSKPKTKPIKVVYIANPMKVNTSASEFRALVQELTGQDAELPPDPWRFRDPGNDDSGGGDAGGGGGAPTEYSKNINCAVKKNIMNKGDEDENDENTVGMMPQVEVEVEVPHHIWEAQVGSSMEWFEPLDEVDHMFTAQMMESISAILPAGSLYESTQVDQVLRSLRAV